MSTAFSLAYPSDRSLIARALLPLVHWRSYLRAVHFLAMFPLGIGYFVFFVTAFALGGALIWTFVGPPVILLALFISLYLGDLEAWMVNVSTGEGIHRPPKVVEGATTLREKVWTRLIDPSTWTGVIYEVVQFPIGIAAFVIVVAGFSVTVWFIVAPLIVWLDPSSVGLSDGPFNLTVDKWWEALPLVPLGLIAWFITIHAITVLSAVHAMWARLMLGSRSRRRPDAITPEGSDPEPKQPVALLPPVEPMPPPAPATVAVEPPPADGDRAPPAAPTLDPEQHPALAELTAREREVLLLVAQGYSNADICEALYISEGTVKTHIRHMLAKLELIDRTQVVVFAYEQGIILPARRPVAMALAR